MSQSKVVVNDVRDVIYENYMPYAVKVLVDRAIPDLQDGLKPSQRRIIYTMHKEKLENKKTKCANIVGTTMKLHPHGDQAIYGTMVRMADRHGAWNLPLIEGKGNFGYINSDIEFAAPRYTEAMMTKISKEYFEYMDAVEMIPSYDNKSEEPKALPVTFPAILANPSEGIAVGYATSIPSFNIHDLLEVTKNIIRNVTVDYLMLKPNFPTGGQIVATRDELRKIWTTGKGSLYMYPKFDLVQNSNHFTMVITELPYGSVARTVIEEVYALAKKDSYFGSRFMSALDETGINGFKITIDLRGQADEVVNYVINKTSLSKTFSSNINVIDGSSLKTLGVKHLLTEWCNWRKIIVVKHFEKEMDTLFSKMELVKAYISFMSNVDIEEWVKLVRNEDEDAVLYAYLAQRVTPFNKNIFEFLLDLKMREIKKFSFTQREEQLKKMIDKYNDCADIVKDPTYFIVEQLEKLQDMFGSSEDVQRSQVHSFYTEELMPVSVERQKFVDTSYVNVGITQDLFVFKNTLRSKMPDGCVFNFQCRACDVIILFSEQGDVYKLYLENIEYTTGKKVGEFIPAHFGVNDIDVVDAKLLEQDMTYIFCDDSGKVCVVNSNEFITEKRKQKHIQNGFAGGEILNSFVIRTIELDNYYIKATSLLGMKATVKISDILRKSRTAKTCVFAGNIDNIKKIELVTVEAVENYEEGLASGVKLRRVE